MQSLCKSFEIYCVADIYKIFQWCEAKVQEYTIYMPLEIPGRVQKL